MPLPIWDSPREITDSGQSHTAVATAGSNPETQQCVRIGNSLFFIYATDATHVWVRRFNLVTLTFDPAVLVDNEIWASYHGMPSIAHDANGALLTLVPRYYGAATYPNNFTLSTIKGRRIPDLWTPGGWSPVAGIPCRIQNNATNFPGGTPIWGDVSFVHDIFSGMGYLIGEGSWLHPIDGRPNIGSPGTLYRVDAAGGLDGPYCPTETVEREPTGYDPAVLDDGYCFTKSRLWLRPPPGGGGASELWLAWQVINSFGYNPIGTIREHQYNVYVAKSIDRGYSWQPVDRNINVGSYVTLGSEHPHMDKRDSRYLAYGGDVQEGSVRGFAVDRAGVPLCLLLTPKAGQSSKVVLGRMDWAQSPSCDLKIIRWNGSRWDVQTIDASFDYRFYLPRLYPDLSNRLWCFAGRYTAVSQRYSDDGGITWSAWVNLASGIDENYRLNVYEDPWDQNYVYLIWQNNNTNKQYFIRGQLTDLPSPRPGQRRREVSPLARRSWRQRVV